MTQCGKQVDLNGSNACRTQDTFAKAELPTSTLLAYFVRQNDPKYASTPLSEKIRFFKNRLAYFVFVILCQVQCPNQLFAEIFTVYGNSLAAVFSLAKAHFRIVRWPIKMIHTPRLLVARAVSPLSLCVSSCLFTARRRYDHNTKTQCRKEKHLLLSPHPRRPKRKHGGRFQSGIQQSLDKGIQKI